MAARTRALARGGGVATRVVTIVGLCLVAVFPVYWMFVTATVPTSDLFRRRPTFLPRFSELGVFVDIIRDSDMGLWLKNSLLIAAGTTILTLVLGIRCGYALSRMRFRGRGALGASLFVTQMLPEALLVVPLYSLFVTFSLLDSLTGLVIVNVAFVLPVVVWLVKSAVDGIPIELEEAARVDGCPLTALVRMIVVPVIRPSIAAAAVLAFFTAWNEYLFAVTFTISDGIKPASVGLASFIGEYQTPVNVVMAGSLIYALPAIAFFLAMQRHVIGGIASGSVKG